MIAVCITTQNRRDVYLKTYEMLKKHLPKDARLFVVDDASDKPAPNADYRFETIAGIAKAKNKCLELAYDWGAEHIFLFDDDIYPIKDGWEKGYVESGENHMMFVFTGKGNMTRGVAEIYRNDRYVAYDHVRGCMLYATRKVLEVVGGMDPEFGRYYGEHADWSNRIHNAGLTPYRVMDRLDSKDYIHSLDEVNAVESTVTPIQYQQYKRHAKSLYPRFTGRANYIEFKS